MPDLKSVIDLVVSEKADENLEALSQVEEALHLLQQKKAELTEALQSSIPVGGECIAAGYVATWEMGRKTTDHKAAALDAGVPDELIAKWTTAKTTTSTQWAKVTAAAVPAQILAKYTTQEPVFTIKVAE